MWIPSAWRPDCVFLRPLEWVVWDVAGWGDLHLCVLMNEHMHAGPWGRLSNPV